MKPKVYIETTIPSYLTAKPSRDLVIAGRQEVTREIWSRLLQECECFVSALVLQEASQGDTNAARKRLATLKGLQVLKIDLFTENLAVDLVSAKVFPNKYAEDALHVAIAAQNSMDFVLTWNFSHINNALIRPRLRNVVEGLGFECPEICSPEELFGE